MPVGTALRHGTRRPVHDDTVREAGTPSWRFEESEGSLLHLALAVRDAAGLPVAEGPAVPPPLVDPPAPVVLGDPERRAAGRQWTGWWTALLGFQVRSTERAAADLEPVGLRFLTDLDAIGAPPDFAGLGDRPELRGAAVAVAGGPWDRRRHHERPEGTFGYELVRQVAEDVAFDRRVSPDRVTGAAVVLDVRGTWWHAPAPGVVLCSRAVTADPRTAHRVLREALESGLRT